MIELDDACNESLADINRKRKDIEAKYHDSQQGDAEKQEEKSLRCNPTICRPITVSRTSFLKLSPQKKSWRLYLNPLRWGPIPLVPKERTVSREHTAGLLSRLYFHWLTPFMNVGYKRKFQDNDVWALNPKWAADATSLKLQACFLQRLTRGHKYALLLALYDIFRKDFLIGGICQLSASIIQALSPFMLRYLIEFAQDAYLAQQGGPPSSSIGVGLAYVFGITLMQMIQSLQINQFVYRGMTVGGASRGALISLIYNKAMKISGRAKVGDQVSSSKDDTGNYFSGEKKKDAQTDHGKFVSGDGIGWSNGRIMSLMSVDSHRVDQASALFHVIWTAPLACVLTLALLAINLSYSALAGFLLLIVGIILITIFVKGSLARRKEISKITDQRITVTQEIIRAVKFVKLFGWETAFLDKLQKIRGREIRAIQVLMAIRNAMNTISMTLPIFASMLTFTTYSLTNHPLEPARVFSSLALFNSLRIPLNLLPQVISQTTDAISSLNRIQEFLMCEEIQEMMPIDPAAEMALDLDHVDFTWERTAKPEIMSECASGIDKKSQPSVTNLAVEHKTFVNKASPFKLQDINLSIGRNELIAIIGGVGCGKSSLLAAIAGDMRKTTGQVRLGATRAFCAQSAWIQNATVKDNILFGKEMQEDWYNQVIIACALDPDLKMLPQGDETEIGERGVTVSGGQKQRVNIARAIYFNADLILMDDPLSAVDAHVGRKIFDEAILRLMKNKARILATHQLWVLSRCDRIVWMEEGRIRRVDTFENLMRCDTDFQKLMKSNLGEKRTTNATENPSEKGMEPQLQSKSVDAVALIQSEERPLDTVSWSVYLDYIRASGSVLNAVISFILLVASQGANVTTSLWLSWWSSDYFGYTNKAYIGVYVALGASQALLTYSFALSLTLIGTISSKTITNCAIARVLRAPMYFFDTTPLGRITNRFSRDVDIMDNELSDAIRMYTLTIVMILTVFFLIIAFFPYFALALFPLFIFFVVSTVYYCATARQLKQIESVLRSHVFAKFSEGLSGIACIRAYGLADRFAIEIQSKIDNMNSAYFLMFATQRWTSIRLDAIGNLLVFVTGILVITSRFNILPSISGLVLSYILSIVQMIQFSIRQLAEVEAGMNATERLHYYGSSLEEEAPLHTIQVLDSWPEAGEITFKNVLMRYRPGLPLVISDINIQIRSGEHIGIVGRTGAGKSSIILALFRLVELSSGSITIDGIDISIIGLHDLRSRLAIIPQDPTLFKGTIRTNLDPFSKYTDLELWSALRQSNLISPAADINDKSHDQIHLDSIVEDEGSNFSLGQRQLMALARALIRSSKIIVCDEATSSIDMETDLKIQHTMATAFKDKTLLCIAHRLKTIIRYDRICVLEQGSIVELDTPKELWKRGGIFKSLCDKSGIQGQDF